MTQNKGHPAAAILREIADEIDSGNPRPWEAFECQPSSGPWEVPGSPHGFFCMALSYPERVRRKPRTKRIGQYDVPLPEREAPKVGTEYWVASADSTSYRFKANWYGNAVDHKRLSRDLVHLDLLSAETHGRALASLMQEDSGA